VGIARSFISTNKWGGRRSISAEAAATALFVLAEKILVPESQTSECDACIQIRYRPYTRRRRKLTPKTRNEETRVGSGAALAGLLHLRLMIARAFQIVCFMLPENRGVCFAAGNFIALSTFCSVRGALCELPALFHFMFIFLFIIFRLVRKKGNFQFMEKTLLHFL
jgi:hypothetical protein